MILHIRTFVCARVCVCVCVTHTHTHTHTHTELHTHLAVDTIIVVFRPSEPHQYSLNYTYTQIHARTRKYTNHESIRTNMSNDCNITIVRYNEYITNTHTHTHTHTKTQ